MRRWPVGGGQGDGVLAGGPAAPGFEGDSVGEDDLGLEDGQCYEVTLGGEQEFGGAAEGAAAAGGAGDLGDLVDGEGEFGVLATEGVDLAGEGLRGGVGEVGELAGVQDGRILLRQDDAEDVGGEVGAVGGEEGVTATVGEVVDEGHDGLVLLGGGGEGVEEEAAIEGSADGFLPVLTFFEVECTVAFDVGGDLTGDDGAKVGVEVGETQLVAEGWGDPGRSVCGVVDAVEEDVGGGGEPVHVTAGEVVVTGDDDAGALVGEASADAGGAVGAEVVEVDAGVTDGHHGAEGAEGFADHETDAGAGRGRDADQEYQGSEGAQRSRGQAVHVQVPKQ